MVESFILPDFGQNAPFYSLLDQLPPHLVRMVAGYLESSQQVKLGMLNRKFNEAILKSSHGKMMLCRVIIAELDIGSIVDHKLKQGTMSENELVADLTDLYGKVLKHWCPRPGRFYGYKASQGVDQFPHPGCLPSNMFALGGNFYSSQMLDPNQTAMVTGVLVPHNLTGLFKKNLLLAESIDRIVLRNKTKGRGKFSDDDGSHKAVVVQEVYKIFQEIRFRLNDVPNFIELFVMSH
jgi:hypothetical protein